MLAKLKQKAKILKTQTAALFVAYKRKDTPLIAKIVAAIAVGYALSPVDLIPDFIPVLGLLDDLLILPLLIALSVKLIPKDIWKQCVKKSKSIWKYEKPQNRIFGFIIIGFYIILFIWLFYKLLT